MTAPAATQTRAAAGTTALTLAATARAVQLAIRAQLLRDVTRLWPALDRKRLDETFPGWLQAMITLVTGYHGQSAEAAARFYQQARTHAIESPTPSTLIQRAAVPSIEWMSRAFGFSGPGMLSRDLVRPNTALSTTLGTASRIALDGGRTTVEKTVKRDPAAVGWYRITDGAPCAFCALVASRGIVYKDEMTAGRTADRKFIGDGEFKYHNDCGCSAAPAFSRNQELPAMSKLAAQIYEERGSGDALNAFRRAWEAHLGKSD